jgi:hypothetical protein
MRGGAGRWVWIARLWSGYPPTRRVSAVEREFGRLKSEWALLPDDNRLD